jgi:hypothetical protein
MAYEPIFPVALQPLASSIMRDLRANEIASETPDGFSVLVGDGRLSAPYRVYYLPPDLRSVIARSSGETQALALCLGTRHWDGFIRQECLGQLVDAERPWTAPFIVQLLGEYVVEIAQVILAALQEGYVAGLAQFVIDNPSFMVTTRQRVVSYWNCYYRRQFPSLQDYPAHIALESIYQMASALPSDILIGKATE